MGVTTELRPFRLRLVGRLALIGVLAACGVTSDAQQLPGSQWTVTEVDGEPVPADEIWLYFERDTAELLTQPRLGNRNVGRHCRKGTAEIVWDSDGHALNFGDFTSGEEGRCAPGMSEWHDRIAQALRSNDRWEASADALTLVGSSSVRLRPEGGSD